MKVIKHTFNGEEKTLDFGKLWYTKFFGEATGTDPLILSDIVTNPAKQFDFVVGLVYGGLNCVNKINKQPLVSLDEVRDMVGSMEDSEVADLINKFAGLSKGEPGEAQTPEANG